MVTETSLVEPPFRTRPHGEAVIASAVLAALLGAWSWILPDITAAADRTVQDDGQNSWYRKTLSSFDADLKAAREAGKPSDEIQVLERGGNAHEHFGETSAAVSLYEQALVVARGANLYGWEVTLLGDLAAAHDERAPNAGIDFLQEQRRAMQGERMHHEAVLEALASEYYTRDDFGGAIETGAQLVSMLQEDKKTREQMEPLSRLASAYEASGQPARAVELMRQAVKLGGDSTDPEVLTYIERLGELDIDNGEPERAEGAFLEIMKRADKGDHLFWAVQAMDDIAMSRAARRDFDGMMTQLSTGVQLAGLLNPDIGPQMQAQLLDHASLGFAWTGKYAEAIANQREKSKIRGGEPNPLDLGMFALRTGRLAEAEQLLRQAVGQYEAGRRQDTPRDEGVVRFDQALRANLDYGAQVYQGLEEVLVARQRPGEALEVAEAIRGRAFDYLLLTRLGEAPRTEPDIPKPKLAELKQIAAAGHATVIEYATVAPELIGYTTTHEFRWGTDPPAETALYIWVIEPSGTLTFRSVDLSKKLSKQRLIDLVSRARESLGTTGQGEGADAAPKSGGAQTDSALRSLYDLLVEPIAEELPRDPSALVVFVPHGPLYLVPFAALQDRDGHYLIDRHTVTIIPSMQVLARTRKLAEEHRRARGGASTAVGGDLGLSLVVGNPTMPALPRAQGVAPERLPQLPGSEAEARRVAQILGTTPLVGDQASEDTVRSRLPSAPLVHIATHGIQEDAGEFRSALALAPTASSDGFLTAREVLGLQLVADLVVLSACDTGRGEIGIDGVAGLARSFIAAGVPTLIASLWRVHDESTAELMGTFYERLKTAPDIAHALRDATLATKAKYPRPVDWAAFTLIGAP